MTVKLSRWLSGVEVRRLTICPLRLRSANGSTPLSLRLILPEFPHDHDYLQVAKMA